MPETFRIRKLTDPDLETLPESAYPEKMYINGDCDRPYLEFIAAFPATIRYPVPEEGNFKRIVYKRVGITVKKRSSPAANGHFFLGETLYTTYERIT
jgi:hypothetical protein